MIPAEYGAPALEKEHVPHPEMPVVYDNWEFVPTPSEETEKEETHPLVILGGIVMLIVAVLCIIIM